MARGGARPGAGRKKREKPPNVADKNAAAKLIDALNRPESPDDSDEIKGWRPLWNSSDARVQLDTRKYLYDKRDGKAVHTVNHLHDKPIEHSHVVSVRGVLEAALQKALKK